MLRKAIILLSCVATSCVLASSIQVNVKNQSGYDVYCSYTTQGDTTATYNQAYSQCHLQNGDNAVPYVTYTSLSGNPEGVLNLSIENPAKSSSGGSAFCTINISNASATVSNNSGSACTISASENAYDVTVNLNTQSK